MSQWLNQRAREVSQPFVVEFATILECAEPLAPILILMFRSHANAMGIYYGV